VATAVELSPLAHPCQPAAVVGQADGGGAPAAHGPVVSDVDHQPALAVAEVNAGRGGTRVLHHVGQRFLDDPVGRQVLAGRQGAGGPSGYQLYLYPGVRSLVQQARKVA
jgi:hypothetical protein